MEIFQILLSRDDIFWPKIFDSVPLPYIWLFKKDILGRLVFYVKQQQNTFKNHT